MRKLKKVLSSEGAIIIYSYLVTILTIFLASRLTVSRVNDDSNTITMLINQFSIVSLGLAWLACLIFLMISIVMTLAWIKEKKRSKL